MPALRERLDAEGFTVPLVGDFHYNGHRLLAEVPELGPALAKFRINPGNVGFGGKRDPQFDQMVEAALRCDRPVRIGVNWGSLDQDLAQRLMDENAARPTPAAADEVMREALVRSALDSAARAEAIGLPADRIVLSAKVSRVPDLIAVYRELARRGAYALHVGLTEAGMGIKGIVASAAALALLLQEGIGDTIRASLTPRPGEARTNEVDGLPGRAAVAGPALVRPAGHGLPGLRPDHEHLFPGACRQHPGLAARQMPVWRSGYPGVETLNVAVMGCIVNGPGESKHADVGISLPGTGETPGGPSVHRREQGADPARRAYRPGVPGDRREAMSRRASAPVDA